jgi:hypothetical protein
MNWATPVICARAVADDAAHADKAKAPASTKPAAALNDELLKGLGPDPLAEPAPAADLDKATNPAAAKPDAANPEQKPAATKSAAKRFGDPLDDELLKGLDDGEARRPKADFDRCGSIARCAMSRSSPKQA